MDLNVLGHDLVHHGSARRDGRRRLGVRVWYAAAADEPGPPFESVDVLGVAPHETTFDVELPDEVVSGRRFRIFGLLLQVGHDRAEGQQLRHRFMFHRGEEVLAR